METKCITINLDGQGSLYVQDWLDSHASAEIVAMSVYNEQAYIIYRTPV